MNGDFCEHLQSAGNPQPRTPQGCEECLRIGDTWLHLRLCLTCGHVGCCDSSEGTHARKHYHATQHPTITPLSTPDKWTWCYIDDAYV